jgi:hypothetical protein
MDLSNILLVLIIILNMCVWKIILSK